MQYKISAPCDLGRKSGCFERSRPLNLALSCRPLQNFSGLSVLTISGVEVFAVGHEGGVIAVLIYYLDALCALSLACTMQAMYHALCDSA